MEPSPVQGRSLPLRLTFLSLQRAAAPFALAKRRRPASSGATARRRGPAHCVGASWGEGKEYVVDFDTSRPQLLARRTALAADAPEGLVLILLWLLVLWLRDFLLCALLVAAACISTRQVPHGYIVIPILL